MKNRNFLLLVVMLLTCFTAIAQPPRGPYVISPKVNADNTITFSYLAPNAKVVLLDGGQFNAKDVPMVKGDQGVWSVTVGPVKPDIYPYGFKVDGITVMDPANAEFFPNERFKGSLVNIPGEIPLMHALKNVPHGTVTYEYYPSMEGSTGQLVVYTPPGYEKAKSSTYPVYYLISGTTDTEEDFFKVAKVNFIMDNMIADGKAKPMIIVMPYGNPAARIAEQFGGSKPTDVMNRDGDDAIKRLKFFENDLITKVIPYVESNYRAIPNADHRAIGGFSRGGGQTLRSAFNNMGTFNYVCSYASYISPSELESNYSSLIGDPAKTNSQLKLLWSGIGTEDFLYKGTTEFNTFLKDKQIELITYETDGGHTWMNVKKYLNQTLPILFK